MHIRVRDLLLPVAVSLLPLVAPLAAQPVNVSVNGSQDRIAVSPYIYGKNDGVGHPSSPLSEAGFQLFRDAGVRMLRMNGGNNGTKYNWQKRLTSHPDWYNNVYASADWDYSQSQLQQHLPGVQAMWCFQLIGKVADNTQNNFNDWGYNGSQWWTGVAQNLAGGGIVNPGGGGDALTEGNPALYLANSTPEISTAILDHWIKPANLGLDRSQFRYWNMDNEPEIWEGTHDDVMPVQLPAEQFMQRYFAYAKAARARYPEIKLVGPVPANEWQWFNWPGGITADGRSYPWLEYFIKRIAEEQVRTGIRLLDVLDIHYYPGTSNPADVVQLHRTFFDETYVHPEANGVKTVNGGWDPSINREYIFVRCEQWLDQYLGPGHGVTFGVSEIGLQLTNAPLASVWYASMLGEFMKHGVEIFTPWTWQPGMWEVLHLFSRYNRSTSVRAVSDDETMVSAYATIDPHSGNTTVVLVNRELTASRATTVSLANLPMPNGNYATLQLANLPASETFVSHASNALASGTVAVAGNQFSITLPPLSITSVLLQKSPESPPPAPGPSRLANVSVRAVSGTGFDVLIVGFYVDGTGSKEILLRGVGPSLAQWIASPVLADPVMHLGSQSTGPITLNDDWGSNAVQITEASARLGAFALDPGTLDSAIVATLSKGGYTALIEGKSGGTGVALGEAYDGDLWGTARLVNVSARTWVGPGDSSLIAGFVVVGGSSKTLLIRAVGPTLADPPYNVEGVLTNPVLRIHRLGEDSPLFQNDNWESISYSEEIASTAGLAGAFSLAPGSNDAVLLLTLPPGGYTAVVSSADGTTGVALVEVYEVQQ